MPQTIEVILINLDGTRRLSTVAAPSPNVVWLMDEGRLSGISRAYERFTEGGGSPVYREASL